MESTDNVVYEAASSNISLLLSTDQLLPSSGPLNSFWISSPSLQGDSVSMVNFRKSPPPYLDKEEIGNEEYDPCFHQPEKKRRLTSNQVEFLEKSFEVENKLEPERKFQLAKDLDLLPRQVAIWFQNRRARYKTKQLDKDFDSLKASYDKLKADYDTLFKENEDLKNEVQLVQEKVLSGGNEQEHCDPNNSVVDTKPTEKANVVNVPVMVVKQEDANSAKSGVFDSDSPNCGEGKQAPLFDPVDSFRVFEQEQSDFSQDEEAELCRIVPPPCLPKLKIESFDDLNADSCNLGNSNDDQPFLCWTY